MSEPRLASGVEVSALLRRTEREGGFGTVLRKGDPERGSILLVIADRGQYRCILERRLQADWSYRWAMTGPAATDSEQLAQHLARVRQRDPDCWLVELDIPSSERFIAETTAEG